MPDLGNYVSLNMASVKTDSAKSIAFLKNTLSNRSSNQPHVVVFLGETHGNAVDQAVTNEMLAHPPIFATGASRVIFERALDNTYGAHVNPGFTIRTEAINENLGRVARSGLIADMIQKAFADDINVVYVPCGSAHASEIYDAMNKRCPVRFTYIAKMSSTD